MMSLVWRSKDGTAHYSVLPILQVLSVCLFITLTSGYYMKRTLQTLEYKAGDLVLFNNH